jgi:hypothetical protein
MTPTERQQMLRRLKYGPKLPRKELALWLMRMRNG